MVYLADENRYEKMSYRRCGRSGLMLPALSLGMWHNFSQDDCYGNMKKLVHKAFDLGITHFDISNTYGPPKGAAEKYFGQMLKEDMMPYRDEMIISTKAGYYAWEGPYGEWCSRKHILSSIDKSLKNLGLDYVDIFYSHRPDPNTPVEETCYAYDTAVRQGKALYVGISNYSAEETEAMVGEFRRLGTPFVIHQSMYNIFDRMVEENGLKQLLEKEKLGMIAYSPLCQGLLTDRYLNGIPEDSRAGRSLSPFLKKSQITSQRLNQIEKLNTLAGERGQSLAQMALSWLLYQGMASVLIGASKTTQLEDSCKCLANMEFTEQELEQIDKIAKEG